MQDQGENAPSFSLAAIVHTLDPQVRPTPPSAYNEALEAAIIECGDDAVRARAACAVYGDWLVEQGDPRGELVLLQCALYDSAADTTEMRRREEELRVEYEYELLGDLAWWHPNFLGVLWRFGFPYHLRVGAFFGDENSLWDAASTLRTVIRQQRLVHRLTIGGFYADGTYDDVIGVIAERGLPVGVRELDLIVSSSCTLGELEPAYERMQEVERLSIETRGAVFGDIDLPALRSFELVTRGLTVGNLQDFRSATWPRLERFAIAITGSGIDDCDVELEDLDWLFDGELAIKHLALYSANIREVLPLLAKSALLPRLSTLDLSRGWLNEADVAALQTHAASLAHLEQLVLPKHFGEEPQVEVAGVRIRRDERYIPIYE
jgi:uncharacterized protein (TIGR02996 family)